MNNRAYQLQTVRAWIDTGEPRMHTILRACEEWNLSYAKSQSLVQDALKGVVDVVAGIDRQEFLVQQLSRLEALAVKAQEEGSLGVALGAFKEIHALIGLYAGQKQP